MKLPRVGETFDVRYQLLELLGAGGVGSVFKALQLDVKRNVALKILHPELLADDEFKQRFIREARALSQLGHSSIVTVYHAGITDAGYVYISMELIEGKSLRDLLLKEDCLPVLRAIAITIKAADVLSFVHKQGIVHRDLKPENIIVSNSPEPDSIKLIDFGLARLTAEQRLTSSGMLIGTANYMSPEQCTGHQVDAKSDIYSLCICLYEMLNGQVPFQADTPVGVLYKHLHELPVGFKQGDLDRFDEDINGFFEKGLAKNAEKRFESMEAMSNALVSLQSVLALVDPTKQIKSSKTSGQLKPTRNWTTPSAITLCFLFAGVSFWTMSNKKQAEKNEPILNDPKKQALSAPKSVGTRITLSAAMLAIKRINDIASERERVKLLDSYLESNKIDSRAKCLFLGTRADLEKQHEKKVKRYYEAVMLAESEYIRYPDADSCDIYLLAALTYARLLNDSNQYAKTRMICRKMENVSLGTGQTGSSRIAGALQRPKRSDFLLVEADACIKQNDFTAANMLVDELEKLDYGGFKHTASTARMLLKLHRNKDVGKLIQILASPYEGDEGLPLYAYEAYMNFQGLIDLFQVCSEYSEWTLAEDCLKKARRLITFVHERNPGTVIGMLEVERRAVELAYRRGFNAEAAQKLSALTTRWLKANQPGAKTKDELLVKANPLNLLLLILEHKMEDQAESIVGLIGNSILSFAPTLELPFTDYGDFEFNRKLLVEKLKPYAGDSAIQSFIDRVTALTNPLARNKGINPSPHNKGFEIEVAK